MSEIRDLHADYELIITANRPFTEIDHIALHAIDRAMKAEKERDELQKRVAELEKEHDELWEQAQTWREESGN